VLVNSLCMTSQIQTFSEFQVIWNHFSNALWLSYVSATLRSARYNQCTRSSTDVRCHCSRDISSSMSMPLLLSAVTRMPVMSSEMTVRGPSTRTRNGSTKLHIHSKSILPLSTIIADECPEECRQFQLVDRKGNARRSPMIPWSTNPLCSIQESLRSPEAVLFRDARDGERLAWKSCQQYVVVGYVVGIDKRDVAVRKIAEV